MWTKSYPQAPDDNSRALVAWDPTRGVFVFEDTESMTHYGYSLSTGQLLWGPVTVPTGGSTDWNYISQSHVQIAYGNLYWCGYSGFLYCFDDMTGNLLWTYGNGGEGNSTYAGLQHPMAIIPSLLALLQTERSTQRVLSTRPTLHSTKVRNYAALTPPPERKYGPYRISPTKCMEVTSQLPAVTY